MLLHITRFNANILPYLLCISPTTDSTSHQSWHDACKALHQATSHPNKAIHQVPPLIPAVARCLAKPTGITKSRRQATRFYTTPLGIIKESEHKSAVHMFEGTEHVKQLSVVSDVTNITLVRIVTHSDDREQGVCKTRPYLRQAL